MGISRPKNWGIVAASDALSAVVVAKDDRRRVDGEKQNQTEKAHLPNEERIHVE